jgi:hypothetical protein
MPSRKVALFAARFLSNKHKDLFLVKMGVTLLMVRYGITGTWAKFFGFFLRGTVGMLMESGIYTIDITLDAIKEGRKLKEFEGEATKLYHKTIAKVYDAEEKEKIRQEYLTIIAKIGNVGNPK